MTVSVMRMPLRRAIAIFVPMCLSVLPAWTQQGDPNSAVKFSVRSELVLVPAVVTDKSGHPISALKKEDFTVMEDGAEQKVATFEEISSSADRPLRPQVPDEFSNSLAAGPTARRMTLIVLDLINTRITDQENARQELLKYLTESIDVREPTGLYTLTRTGLEEIHDFTSDPRILVAALHQVKGDPEQMVDSVAEATAYTETAHPGGGRSAKAESAGPTKAAVQSEAGKLQGMLQDAELNFKSFEQRMAITYTLQGMQEIAQALAGFPGRKALIWASGGFPFTVSGSMGIAPAGRDTLADVMPLYEHTWQLLNDAEVSLYPVDVKGLRVTGLPSASVSNTASVRNPAKNNRTQHSISRSLDTQSTFQTFAAMTGGRAYYNSNDLVKGFREAVHDSSQYYMLGYYLDRSISKSGWRSLTVKVHRDHTEVRARNGFFVTDTTLNPDATRSNDISIALHSPLDFTALALLAHWDNVQPGDPSGTKRVSYQMHLSPEAGVINEEDHNHVVLDFVALAVTPDGKPAGQPHGQKIDLHLSPEKLAAIRQRGIAYQGSLNLPPGQYTVRFVVRDDLTGRTGSVAGPLKVD